MQIDLFSMYMAKIVDSLFLFISTGCPSYIHSQCIVNVTHSQKAPDLAIKLLTNIMARDP